MKSLLLKIKNMLPYLLLISIYFFFINIEARNNQKINQNKNNDSSQNNNFINDKTKTDESNLTISIPVIPFNQ